MKFIAGTDVGKKRKKNEDSFFAKIYDNKIALYIVADGLGGYLSGEIASKMLIDTISSYIEDNLVRLKDLEEINVKNILKVSLTLANQKIFDLEKKDEKYKGMGTTICLVLQVLDKIYYMSVGDSRMYYISNDLKNIKQITTDDTYVNELVKTKVITKEEAKTHPQKHVLTKAVGILKNITCKINVLNENNGYLILCSDGVSNMISEEDLLKICSKNKFELVIDNVINTANLNGGVDNITAIFVKI